MIDQNPLKGPALNLKIKRNLPGEHKVQATND